MKTRRILICNERILARFGVDRILVLLARDLLGRGHTVEMACLRSDHIALGDLAVGAQEIPIPDGLDLASTERAVCQHLREQWLDGGAPDVIVTGGWPFFSVAASARSFGARSVFIDAGAVPHDGLSDEKQNIQRELRRIRQTTLPSIDEVLPISEFIKNSQTLSDRGNGHRVRTVLLGADHLPDAGASALSEDEQKLIDEIDDRSACGEVFALLLGRFESEGYKNSPAAFDVLSRLLETEGNIRLLVLAGSDIVNVPEGLAEAVEFLPMLSDDALSEVMSRVSLGLSVSLWEGFNLPLAEMQWLGKPSLAFNVGAHPEVIADPALLCSSIEEMVRKAGDLLRGERTEFPEVEISRFRQNFTWKRTLRQWREAVEQVGEAEPIVPNSGHRRLVLVDVTNSARDPANSGVVRVTRRLAAGLAAHDDLDLRFVSWDPSRSGFVALTNEQREILATNGGPQDLLGPVLDGLDVRAENFLAAMDPNCPHSPVLLMPEIALDGATADRQHWGKKNGCSVAAIFYDMIPIIAPEFVDQSVRNVFPDYLRALTKADALWSISEFSRTQFDQYVRQNAISAPKSHETVWLPGQFGSRERVQAPAEGGRRINILCISTIEPRKNHRTLLEAFEAVRARRPDLPIYLDLVGNRYANADDLAELVNDACAKDHHIKWLRILPDSTLAEIFERADFTVYPSVIEGFGLPVLESLWMARPCVCNETGVMEELAKDGGCVTVDTTNYFELSLAIERLADDADLRRRLSRQALRRKIGTWQDYANDIHNRLAKL